MPPLPGDADYITRINRCMYEECRADRNDRNEMGASVPGRQPPSLCLLRCQR